MPQWAKVGIGTGSGCIFAMSLYLLYNPWRKKSDVNVVVFTRYPTPGATKTRLFPALGPKGAAWTQRYMSEHIFKVLGDLVGDDSPPHVTVEYSGAIEPQINRWLHRRFKNMDVTWTPQLPGTCLGDKLADAFHRSFDQKYTHTIVIGSDIPGISVAVLKEAVEHLQSPTTDVVLGKASDGGYYLIGIKNNCIPYIDDIFTGMNWGREEVFQQQCRACRRLELRLHVLSDVLSDIDYPEDLPVFEESVGVSAKELQHPRWSVIIPTYNEADNIEHTFQELLKSVSSTDNLAEIIVSDGGSTDNTVDVCREFAKSSPVKIKIILSNPGRGVQQRAGVKEATGSLLIFLHADTKLPQNFDVLGVESLAVPGNVGAAFLLDFDGLYPEYRKSRGIPVLDLITHIKLRIILWIARLTCTILSENPYGDQALMMTKKSYDEVGGFDPVLLLEDYIMVRKLQKIGHVVTLPEAVITSSRRFETKGVFYFSLINVDAGLTYYRMFVVGHARRMANDDHPSDKKDIYVNHSNCPCYMGIQPMF